MMENGINTMVFSEVSAGQLCPLFRGSVGGCPAGPWGQVRPRDEGWSRRGERKWHLPPGAFNCQRSFPQRGRPGMFEIVVISSAWILEGSQWSSVSANSLILSKNKFSKRKWETTQVSTDLYPCTYGRLIQPLKRMEFGYAQQLQ